MEEAGHSETLVITHETTRCNKPGQPTYNLELHRLVLILFKNVFSDSKALRNGTSGHRLTSQTVISDYEVLMTNSVSRSPLVGQLGYISLFNTACLFVFSATAPQWVMASTFTRFLDHTQRRTTVGRTPWTSDQLVAETST